MLRSLAVVAVFSGALWSAVSWAEERAQEKADLRVEVNGFSSRRGQLRLMERLTAMLPEQARSDATCATRFVMARLGAWPREHVVQASGFEGFIQESSRCSPWSVRMAVTSWLTSRQPRYFLSASRTAK